MVTVLVLMAVLLAAGLVGAAIGRDELLLSGIVEDGNQAFSVADGCLEDAVNRFKQNGGYAGGSYALSGGSCVVTVVNPGGNTRLVSATATYANNSRAIDANVTLKFNAAGNAKTVIVNSWLESN